MLQPDASQIIPFPADCPPLLFVIVDTEEEFDWSKPHDRSATGVSNIACQETAHAIYDENGLKPLYVVDYPVASQADGVEPLRGLLADSRCDIGSHLHPWVSPPHEEQVSARNSYPGNLPPALEEEKLKVLGDKITESFGVRPTVYRAGRFGVGPATAGTLSRLGYRVDTSVLPRTDLSAESGPDFSSCPIEPYWCGPEASPLLEIPATQDYCGLLQENGPRLFDGLRRGIPGRLRMGGVFARLGLLERMRLTPEAMTPADQIRLVRSLYARGVRVFSYTYHSSSLLPGGSPYAPTLAGRDRLVDNIRGFMDQFFGSLGGEAVTVFDILRRAEEVMPPPAKTAAKSDSQAGTDLEDTGERIEA